MPPHPEQAEGGGVAPKRLPGWGESGSHTEPSGRIPVTIAG